MKRNTIRNRALALSVFLGLLLACSPAPNLLSTPETVLMPAPVPLAPAATPPPVAAERGAPKAAPQATFSIQGTEFMAGGHPVVLRGAVVPHFIYQQIVDYPPYFMWIYHRDIDRLKTIGANFVVVDWNSGYLNEPGYVENLVGGLEYAKEKGLWVELVLHSRGRKAGSIADPVQITVADDQVVADWASLLHDPLVSKRIASSVDLFGPLSEPDTQAGGKSEITWNQWQAVADRAIQIIRDRTARPQAPIALSGVHWASNASGALSTPPNMSQVAIELHPYQANGANFPVQVTALRKRGYTVFAGELGCQDPLSYSEHLLDYLTANQIGFAVYSMISDSHDPRCTMQTANGVFSPLGNLVLQYYSTAH